MHSMWIFISLSATRYNSHHHPAVRSPLRCSSHEQIAIILPPTPQRTYEGREVRRGVGLAVEYCSPYSSERKKTAEQNKPWTLPKLQPFQKPNISRSIWKVKTTENQYNLGEYLLPRNEQRAQKWSHGAQTSFSSQSRNFSNIITAQCFTRQNNVAPPLSLDFDFWSWELPPYLVEETRGGSEETRVYQQLLITAGATCWNSQFSHGS